VVLALKGVAGAERLRFISSAEAVGKCSVFSEIQGLIAKEVSAASANTLLFIYVCVCAFLTNAHSRSGECKVSRTLDTNLTSPRRAWA
jgi:hypothetical protein